jgi:DNA invertase Pin-like site-specific DNA recombinase
VLVGYARVSTEDQITRLQLDALNAAGVTTIFQEKTSAISARPELARAIESLRPGDCLVVWKLDRLARSLADLLKILERLADRGASFRSLTEPVDTTTPMGIFIVQVLGAVAQLERSLIIQRTTAGIRAARARGVQWGRKPLLSHAERLEVAHLAASGIPPRAIADAYGISRPLVYKIAELQGCNKKPTETVGL